MLAANPIKLLFLAVIGVSLLAMNLPVFAASQRDLDAVFGNSIFYDDRIIATASCGGGGGINPGIDSFMKALALQESGGRVTVQNTVSSASGKYQYLSGTWKDNGSKYYPPSQDYPEAYLAPEETQDALVFIEYTDKAARYGNDPFTLAVTHFYGSYPKDESKLDIIPPGNVKTPREYGNDIVAKIKSGESDSIPLKYSQAPEFAQWLAKVKSDASSNGDVVIANCSSVGGINGNSIAPGGTKYAEYITDASCPSNTSPAAPDPSRDIDANGMAPMPGGYIVQLCDIGGGLIMNASIAGSAKELLIAAEAAGVKFAGYGYRSHGRQIQLRIANCGASNVWKSGAFCSPPTAVPGNSLHEYGLAMDLNEDGRQAICYKNSTSWCRTNGNATEKAALSWLDSNAKSYGFSNLASEAWHWDIKDR